MEYTFPYRLYLVISEESCPTKDFIEVAEQAILGGVDIVQLREKKATTADFLAKALRLQEMLAKYNVPLIINDNLEVAQKSLAYGIHVGNHDISPTHIKSVWKAGKSVGYSIEYLSQLQNEETQVADCLGISPVFSSKTKTDTVTTWGLSGIAHIRSLTSKPLIAIGNMQASNAYKAIKAGADCIAVVSAICQAANPMKAASDIRNQIEKAL